MPYRIKLLFVVEDMGGGVFTYIVDLTNGLVDKYDMYLAYTLRPQPPSDYKDYFDERIHLIEVKKFTRSVESLKEIKAFFEIRKIADEVKPYIIPLHSSKASALDGWTFNGKKFSLFYTPHGYCFLMKNHSAVKRYAFKMIKTVNRKWHCTTISSSEGEHQETRKFTKRAAYSENGINIEQLNKLLSDITSESDQPFTVFTLGHIWYQKTSMLFNDTAEALSGIPFLWIEDGEMRDELISPNIEITGWLDRKNALSRSVSADVFLLTYLWVGLPISLLEAMYMKKSGVVNDIIGNHNVIQSGESRYVCKEVSEFVEIIESVQDGKSSELVDAAYEDILHKYNKGVMAEEYSTIYDEALVKLGWDYILLAVYSSLIIRIQITPWSATSAVHEKVVA